MLWLTYSLTATTTECDAATSIVIEQRDLQFDHPASSMSVQVRCPCYATDIILSCGSSNGWDQSLVNPSYLTIEADGTCLLLNGLHISPYAPATSFIYQHSPPLPNPNPLYATFFNCSSIPSSSGFVIILTITSLHRCCFLWNATILVSSTSLTR